MDVLSSDGLSTKLVCSHLCGQWMLQRSRTCDCFLPNLSVQACSCVFASPTLILAGCCFQSLDKRSHTQQKRKRIRSPGLLTQQGPRAPWVLTSTQDLHRSHMQMEGAGLGVLDCLLGKERSYSSIVSHIYKVATCQSVYNCVSFIRDIPCFYK